MGLFDTLLKSLITADAPAFAAWLLATEIATVETLASEVLAEPVRADAALRVSRPDGRQVLLHIEFQGRSSRPPVPWRMLDYMTRFAVRERIPLASVVVYTEPGAGVGDSGQHEHPGADEVPVLIWRYQVIHLWRWSAEEVLALGRPGLLPLNGLTRISEPARTLPRVVAAIQAEPERERQLQLLHALIDLLPSEELIAMAQQAMTSEDIEQIKRFPSLWRQYQEAVAEGARQQFRANILEVLVARFDPPASEYRRLQEALAGIEEMVQLETLFQRSLRAGELTEVVAAIHAARP